MITFLSSAKPFIGLDKENQIRAIRSWKSCAEGAEVILYGDTEGQDLVAKELSVKVHRNVEASEFGTPLFDSIVTHAENVSTHDFFVYLNCDVIMNASLARVIFGLKFRSYLLVGQRIDLGAEVKDLVDVKYLDENIKELAAKGMAKLHWARGSDYFAFSRGTWDPAPSVTIGRAGYDNVLIWDCLKRKIPVIDCTLALRVYHQFHGYGHVAGGKDEVYSGEEARRNTRLLPPNFRGYLESASHRFSKGEIVGNFARNKPVVYLHLLLNLKSNLLILRIVDRVYWRIVRFLRLGASREYSLKEVIDATESSGSEKFR